MNRRHARRSVRVTTASIRSSLRLLILLSVAMLSSRALATEGGGTGYPLGINTIIAGIMPPPGFYVFTYMTRYDSNHTLDNNGNDKAGISNFGLHTNALAFRLSQVWKPTFLGANIETRLGVPIVDLHLNFNVATPKGVVNKNGAQTGLADIAFDPILLGWHSTYFHQIAGMEFILPTGRFSQTELINPGRNYYSIAPVYFFTFFPTQKAEISAKLIYLINTINPQTGYHSGNEAIVDYNLGYFITPAWQIGASGYFYKQTTDDKQNDQSVAPDGNRGRVLSTGPFIKYQPTKAFGVVLKWQHEMLVENRARGDRIFLQFAFKFWD